MFAAELLQVLLGQIHFLRQCFAQQCLGTRVAAAHGARRHIQAVRGFLDTEIHRAQNECVRGGARPGFRLQGTTWESPMSFQS